MYMRRAATREIVTGSYSLIQAERTHDMSGVSKRPILSVEDNDEDFHNLCMALEDAGVTNRVRRCPSSRIATDAIGTVEGCAEARESAFVLLSLDIRGLENRTLLEQFRQRERKLPVIVLSKSSQSDDVAFCYRAGANGYLVKPVAYAQWREMMATVAAYWLHTAMLPHFLR
jgi:CheY-like chemotaxis protein